MAFRGLAFFEGFEVKGLEAALLPSIISNEGPLFPIFSLSIPRWFPSGNC